MNHERLTAIKEIFLKAVYFLKMKGACLFQQGVLTAEVETVINYYIKENKNISLVTSYNASQN